ncbi:MAG: tyrosine-type recombinase/integrase [Nibricoccus sp.]
MRSTKPHVKRWKWGGPGSEWVVDGLRDENGKRIRKFFSSRDAANEWLRQRRPELKNQGRATMALTDAQRLDAVRALAVLEPYGVSLAAAAEAFAERAKLLDRTVTFKVLREEILATKEQDGMSPSYLVDLKARLTRFGEDYDKRQVATIETRELDDWLRALDLAPISRANFRKVLRTAFEYAVSRGYARENPVAKTAAVKVSAAVPGILKPIEVEALLRVCDPRVLPSIALGAFAGIRDAEIARMTWDMVDLKGGHIKIGVSVAKTNSRRIIPMAENLKAWLASYAQHKGSIRGTPSQVRTYMEDARGKALAKLRDEKVETPGLAEWPHNALRHSYASYRMAIVANAAQVAEECGHSVQIMKEHYRELVTKAEAEAWFAVTPAKKAGNLIPFAEVADA